MTTGTHTVTAGTHAVVPAWRDWRSWVDRLVHAWRRSMRFRTLALTLGLTALTILVALVWMALAIQNDLYDSRTQQMLIEAQRATASAQQTLDAAEEKRVEPVFTDLLAGHSRRMAAIGLDA